MARSTFGWGVVGSLVLVVVAVAGCEDDSTGSTAGASSGNPFVLDGGGEAGQGDDGGPPPMGSASAFCDGTLGVVARALEGCCSASDKTTGDYRFTHDLVAALEPVCTSTLDASIVRGRMAFHPSDATDCYAAYSSTYAPGKCANITTTYSDPAGTTCRHAFTGVVVAGGACAGDHECLDGLTCVGYTKSADGSCRVPGAIGEPCGAARVDGGGSGESSLELGSHPSCAAGARCASTSGTCVAAGMSGASCFEDAECAAPLLCHLGACGAAGPAVAGGACKTKSDCAGGFYCAADGMCAAKKAAGGACQGASFETECIGRCNAATGATGTCASFCGSP